MARFKTENEMLKLSVYNQTDACRRIKIERTDLQDRLEDAKNQSEQNKLFGNGKFTTVSDLFVFVIMTI